MLTGVLSTLFVVFNLGPQVAALPDHLKEEDAPPDARQPDLLRNPPQDGQGVARLGWAGLAVGGRPDGQK